MSTAGKVLVVLVMLSAVACMILAGGVAKLNQNGNEALEKIAAQLAKAQEDLDTARRDIVSLRDQTILSQEKIDRDIAVLEAQQTALERHRSQIVNELERAKYELGTVTDTIARGKAAVANRTEEFDAEEKALADLRRNVQELKTTNGELMGRLKSLRDQFQDAYHSNVDMLGKRH
jgi:chromosome segregation ATPase